MRKLGGKHEGRQRWEASPSILRLTGRLAIWFAVGLVLVRGGAGLFAAPGETEVVRESAGTSDEAVVATAERFARLYLEEPSPKALDPYLAAGARVGSGRPPSARAARVAQADVVETTDVGDGRVVVTVSCELRDARTLYLTVPIVRRGPGEASVLGAPSIVAMPAPAGADPERPRPIAGPNPGAIDRLISKFIPAYVSAGSASDLSYLVAPGPTVVPLGGGLEVVSIGHARQLGGGEGADRDLIVAVELSDPESGAEYPLAYRLRVIERAGRWYVSDIEGAVA
ncbi:MAG: conjugal transfer protein [Solirubrobacterales bacterium]